MCLKSKRLDFVQVMHILDRSLSSAMAVSSSLFWKILFVLIYIKSSSSWISRACSRCKWTRWTSPTSRKIVSFSIINDLYKTKETKILTFIFSSNTQCDIFKGSVASRETLFSRGKQLFFNDVWSRWVSHFNLLFKFLFINEKIEFLCSLITTLLSGGICNFVLFKGTIVFNGSFHNF